MSSDAVSKVTAARLSRDAYLYIRQSTLYQVASNTESTARQYDLQGRALTLGCAGRADPRHRHRPGPLRRLRR